MSEVMCPHCPNMIDESDITCSHCGETVEQHNPLTLLCLQFGIPPIVVRDGKECAIFELKCRADGIQANYMVPGEVQEIKVEGVLH